VTLLLLEPQSHYWQYY